MKVKLLVSLILIETSFFTALASIAKAQNFQLTTKRFSESSELQTTEVSPLSREETIASNNTILQRQGVLENGDSAMSSDSSLYDVYTFEGRAGQSVTITLESGAFDPYLILLDSDRQKIAENDDISSNNRNSGLTVTLPKTGTYIVVVNGYNRNSRGAYTVTVNTPQPIATDSSPSSNQQSTRPQVPTWQEFVEQGGERFIDSDYDLPAEFRNGYVYFIYGADVITVFILKQGLSSYPEPGNIPGQINHDLAMTYVNSGQAISIYWGFSNSGSRYANDMAVRYPQPGMGCFKSTCLTAPFMSNAEISRILLSERAMEESTYGQQTASGQAQQNGLSLLVSANTESVPGVTVELAKQPLSLEDLRRQSNYTFAVDRVNAIELRDGTRVFSFVVYNTGNADGVVEVRNARGELVEVRGIDGFRMPSNVAGFAVESIKKLWTAFNELIDIWGEGTRGRFVTDPRFVSASQKTEIKNIAVPPGGTMTLTKAGENSIAYNYAMLLTNLFFEGLYSETEGRTVTLPGNMNRILGNNPNFKQKFLGAVFSKIQQQRIGSLVKAGAFQTPESTLRAFSEGNWIKEEDFKKLMEICLTALAEEALKEGIEQTVVNEQILGRSLSSWMIITEVLAKSGQVVSQMLNMQLAERIEQDPRYKPFDIIIDESAN